MIEKIVVIAMGLVSIVPHGTKDGATVLLRDAFLSTPRAALSAGGKECPVHLHVPLLMQTAGRCEGDCAPLNLDASATQSLAARMLGLGAASTDVKLRWVPVMESVDLGALTGTPAAHDEDYWFEYGNQSARVQADEDCLDDAFSCPIVSRLHMAKGGMRACTLAQYRDSTRSGPAGFMPKKFEDVADPGMEPASGEALADSYAIELPTSMRAPLRLVAKSFGGGRTTRSADLYPDDDGVIVLVVSNLPLDTSHGHGAAECKRVVETATAHSAVVYDLAEGSWPAANRVVPHMAKKVSSMPAALTCNYSLGIAAQMPAVLEYPSNPAKCKPPGVMAEP